MKWGTGRESGMEGNRKRLKRWRLKRYGMRYRMKGSEGGEGKINYYGRV